MDDRDGGRSRIKMMVRSLVIFFFILFLVGLPPLAVPVMSVETDSTSPILRHRPPMPLRGDQTWYIRVVVEDASEMKWVRLRYRSSRSVIFKKIVMRQISDRVFGAQVVITTDLRWGIDYYIEAEDRFGNQGHDGDRIVPYFVPVIGPFLSDERDRRPAWWREHFFWVSVVLAIAGKTLADSTPRGTGKVIVK